jgi:TRAP-type mannitol/chloroaromatic compound transport system permease large subunit
VKAKLEELVANPRIAIAFRDNGTLILILFIVFLLGFFLDWMEIILIVAPLVLPVLTALGHDPAWVAILMAICLQTSFLTPPVGMALFYLKNAVPDVEITQIYRAVLPFVAMQIGILVLTLLVPKIALW